MESFRQKFCFFSLEILASNQMVQFSVADQLITYEDLVGLCFGGAGSTLAGSYKYSAGTSPTLDLAHIYPFAVNALYILEHLLHKYI